MLVWSRAILEHELNPIRTAWNSYWLLNYIQASNSDDGGFLKKINTITDLNMYLTQKSEKLKEKILFELWFWLLSHGKRVTQQKSSNVCDLQEHLVPLPTFPAYKRLLLLHFHPPNDRQDVSCGPGYPGIVQGREFWEM